MSDATAHSTPATPPASSLFKQDDRVKRRNAAEKRFKAYGLAAIGVGVTMLIILVSSVLSQGLSSFRQTFVTLPVTITQAEFEAAEASMLKTGKYKKLIQRGLEQRLATAELSDVVAIKDAMGLLSGQAPADLRVAALSNQTWPLRQEFRFLANGRVDGYFKGRVTMEIAERDSRISPEQLQL